jgi:hypothetical protein
MPIDAGAVLYFVYDNSNNIEKWIVSEPGSMSLI